MIKIAFLGNCQVDVYGRLLAASEANNLSVATIEIWRYKPSDFNVIRDRLRQMDIVITQPLSESYTSLSTPTLRSSCNKLLVIHNIYFRGYHPDCVYLGPVGARLKSPVGDYHSQLIHDYWRAGKPVNEAIRGLLEYDLENVQSIYNMSSEELLAREANVDIPVSQYVLNAETGYTRFFTFNHPTIELHRLYLQLILNELALDVCIKTIHDPLLLHTRWPIYPAVYEYLGLHRSTMQDNFVFIPSASLGNTAFNLDQFCELSYRAYESTGA